MKAIQDMCFNDALQQTNILIDADMIGSAILLREARSEFLPSPTVRKVLYVRTKLEIVETLHKISEGFEYVVDGDHLWAPMDRVSNAYFNRSRGILFYFKPVPSDAMDRTSIQKYNYESMIHVAGETSGDGKLAVTVFTTMEAVDDLCRELLDFLAKAGFEEYGANIVSVAVEGKDVVRRSVTIDTTQLGHHAFYPMLPCSISAYADAFMSSRANVLFLIGEPRTGKSTLIRTIINHLGIPAVLSSDVAAIESGAVFAEDEEGSEGMRVLVLEDVEAILAKREDANRFMGRLLNEVDGVGKSSCKLIVSTNLSSVEEVDPALIGPGRTFDILEFGKLTPEQSFDVALAVGKDPALLEAGKKYTVGEICNIGVTGSSYFSFKGKTDRGIGFGRR